MMIGRPGGVSGVNTTVTKAHTTVNATAPPASRAATATPLAPAYVAAPAIAQISSPPVGSDLPPSGPDPSSSQSSAAEKALGKLPTPRGA